MRKYDETTLKVAERVMKRSDEIVSQRKKKAAKIRHISYSVSGLCAAILVCFGVWKLNPSIKKPDDGFKGLDIIITTETTESVVSTENKTTSTEAKTTTTKTSSVTLQNSQTTATTSNANTATVSIAAIKTTANIPLVVHTTQTASVVTSKVITSINDVSETISMTESPITTSQMTISTEAKTTQLLANTTHVTELDLQESFRSSPCSFKLNDNIYEKEDSCVHEDNIGSHIKDVAVQIKPPDTLIAEYMEAYEVQDVSIDEAVAVKLKDTDEYYLFRNTDYKKEDDIT